MKTNYTSFYSFLAIKVYEK